jgi:uncharacterized protein (UPF0332 family)
MSDDLRDDLERYMERAQLELQAVDLNLQKGFYAVAVSRAYYAMFYAATALLKSNNIERSKHTGVISAFGQYFVKNGLIEAEYAKMLTQAFDSRNDTDYDLMLMPNEEFAQAELDDAKGLIVFNFGLWYTIKRQGSVFSPKLFVNAP